jgi:hypothetical protein
MSNQLEQERHSRLQFPVHKIKAKTPEELFEILPGMRRYFQKLIPDGKRHLVKDDKENVIKDGDGNPVEVDGYEAHYRGFFPEDLVRIVKFIVFVYDPETDLMQEYEDNFSELKNAAASEAGFRRNKDGEWPLYVQDILQFKEKQVISWIIDYLKVKKNPIWMEIKFVEEELEQLYRTRARAIESGDIKSDTMRLVNERLELKARLYKQFYAQHNDLKKVSEEELYPVSPENVFKELKVPAEVWQMRQVRDVPKETGVDQAKD